MNSGTHGRIRGRRGIFLRCAQGGGGDEGQGRWGRIGSTMVHLSPPLLCLCTATYRGTYNRCTNFDIFVELTNTSIATQLRAPCPSNSSPERRKSPHPHDVRMRGLFGVYGSVDLLGAKMSCDRGIRIGDRVQKKLNLILYVGK